MASRENFKNDYRRDSESQDIYKKRKNMVLEKDISENWEENIIEWNTFWRRNIHRFIIDAMGIKLYPYQIIWIYLMSISPFFVGVCARTTSKSFLVACFAVAHAILYPGSTILISSSTLKQAGLIVSDKVTYLKSNSELCQLEIKNITANNNLYYVDFYCGSKIVVVAANEGSRGWRSNVLIIDEYAITNKEIVDTVLMPTLFPRQAPYLQLPEYEDLIEPVRVFYLSTARYAHEWWYKTALSAINGMIEGDGSGFFATDYLTTLRHNLKTKEQMDLEKKNNPSFSLEYENIPGKSNMNSFYQIGMFKRDIKKAFYPVRPIDYGLKKNLFGISKLDGEIRIIGADFASRAAKANDNSVIACVRLIPSKRGYERHLVYMESSHGKNHILQARNLKSIWHDFQADYISMDIANIGISVYECLGESYNNEERGLQLPPFSVMEIPEIDEKIKEELREKTLGINAIPVIFPISANKSLNTEMHVKLKSSLQLKLWHLLVDDVEAERFLVATQKEFFSKDDETISSWLLHPFIQVNFLISEAVNLEVEFVGSDIKLSEVSGARKDRYSALIHANFLASVLDKNIMREEDEKDGLSVYESMTMIM